VLSCDELRYWMKELYTNPALGWAGHSGCLASAFGIDGACPAGTYKGCFRRSWIYPGQQLRFSRQLAKILAGEIVCRKVGGHHKAVLADSPQPLRLPTRMRYDLGAGRLGWAPTVVPTGPRLPSFKELFSHPTREWIPTRDRPA
jgi:hypothetical protein